MNFLKVKIRVNIFVTTTAYSSPNFKQWDMVLSHFVIMVQNCGTPSQQRLRSLKIYTISRKMLLNGAHQLNVMCSSYSDVHDIYICTFVYIYMSCIYFSLYMWDSWCGMYCLCLILSWFLNPFSFFRCLLPKDKIIMFYCFHELYESFDDMDTMH